MLHAKDESFVELRAAALKFESQQRLFMELGASMTGTGRGHGVFQVQEEDGAEEEYQEDQCIEAVVGKGTQKCNKCGKAGHFARECVTDMTKVKCFKCGHEGHIGANCKSAAKAKAQPLAKPKPKAQSKGSPRKTQSKGRGKGKKGKLNEVGEGEEATEKPEEEWPEEGEAEEEWAEESAPVSGLLMMPSVEEASDGWMYWLLDSGAACSVLSESDKLASS